MSNMGSRTAGRRARRQFSEEFRIGAVRLILDEGKTVGAVARELDLTPSALAQWVKQARADRTKGKAGLTTIDFDEATINPIAFETLQRVAEEIRMRPGLAARVEGHTDGRGSDAYNQDLSERRAESVRSWLVSEGQLQDVVFETSGFGATQPVARETRDGGADDPVGRAQNRRVEIVLSAG